MNYYAIFRFGRSAVSGILIFGAKDPNDARKMVINKLNVIINREKEKYDNKDSDTINRLKAFRRTFSKPWRKHFSQWSSKDPVIEEPVLEFIELPDKAVHLSDYWLGGGIAYDYIVNRPRIRKQDPSGFVVSQLTPVENVATT